MNGKELALLVADGIRPVVTFQKPIEDMEGYLEAGMRGRLVASNEQRGGRFEIYVDLTEFDNFNKQFESANYYDKSGVPCLTARQAGNYKEPKENFYVDSDQEVNFLVVEEGGRLALHQEFVKSCAKSTYVQWLEDRVIAGLAK